MEINITLNTKKVSFPNLDVFLLEDGSKALLGYYRLGKDSAVLSCAYVGTDGKVTVESADILSAEDEKKICTGQSISESVLSNYRCLSSSGSGVEVYLYATEDGNVLHAETVGRIITKVYRIELSTL